MTTYQYTLALMVFLVAYAIFEVPSNYFLKKLRPSVRVIHPSIPCFSS